MALIHFILSLFGIRNVQTRHPAIKVGGIVTSARVLDHVESSTVAWSRKQWVLIAVFDHRYRFMTGDNGALGAFNVLLDVYEPGERIGR